MSFSMPCKCCGSPVAFEEHDRGYEAYCRSCGRANEVPVGEPARSSEPVRLSEPARSGPARPRRPARRFHPAWIPLVGTLLGACLWLATQAPEDLFSRWLGRASPDDLPELEELIDDSADPATASTGSPFEPAPDPEITLARIEELPRRHDPLDALIQAQVWQESLSDSGAARDDRRHARLKEMIVDLKAAIAPTESELSRRRGEIEKALDDVVGAIRSHDAARARRCFDQAWGLVRNEADPAFHARRLLTLKVRLETQEATAQGAGDIQRCLEQADKALDSGRICEAIRAQARARFLARITPGLSEADVQQLRARTQRLAPRMQLARGRRAAAEARQADGLRDPATRDGQAFRAYSLLAGLPEGEIRPLLEGLREWYQRALQRGGPQALPDPSSTLGREIQWRDAYERVLQHYGDADCAKLTAACRDLDATEQALSGVRVTRPEEYPPLEPCLFDVLERETVARLAAVSGSQSDRLEPTLVALRELLDQASPWQGHDRWRLLDATLRQEGNALALGHLKSAVALAEEDRLEEAVGEAEGASRFGWSEVRRQAAQMRKPWQSELHLRARADVQERAWRRLRALKGKDERLLQFWSEARRFLKWFPRSPHRREVQRWTAQAEATLPVHVAAAIQDTTNMVNQQDWSGARVRFAWLRSAPIPPADVSAFEALKTRWSEVKAAAEHEFLLLEQSRPPTEESHVLALLEKLPRVLAMAPEHAEAQQLLQSTRRQAALRAGKLINAALPFRAVNPDAYREKLRRAVQLDSDGPCGKKAKELLGEYGDLSSAYKRGPHYGRGARFQRAGHVGIVPHLLKRTPSLV